MLTMLKSPKTLNPDLRDVFVVLRSRGISQSWLAAQVGGTLDELSRLKHGYERKGDLKPEEFIQRALIALRLSLPELRAIARAPEPATPAA